MAVRLGNWKGHLAILAQKVDFMSAYADRSEPRRAFAKQSCFTIDSSWSRVASSQSTIRLRLAANRRLACETDYTGLLGPELAAGMRRVKDAKRVDVRLGKWLTTIRGKRERAIIGVLAEVGLSWSEVAQLKVVDSQTLIMDG